MSTRLFRYLGAKLGSISTTYKLGRVLEKNCQALLFHQKKQLSASSSTTSSHLGNVTSDTALIGRIISAYRDANKEDLGDSIWKEFFSTSHISIHEALMNGKTETVGGIFRDPGRSDLLYGFDILTKGFNGCFNRKSLRSAHAKLCLDGLVRFAEAAGVSPVDNPERWHSHEACNWETEEVLKQLSNKCWPFTVPNPFPEEHGLATSRGIISYRVPQAIYQAWRIKHLVRGLDKPRILEIGAGLGRTAYYAYELGLKDYSVVDIPITSASQAYFLGRTLGEDKIHLDGENAIDLAEKIKILTPQNFLKDNNSYDLIFNADSLTEMDFSTAKSYLQKISSSANTFFSINHESNLFIVRDLIAQVFPNVEIIRNPSWMRHGYVEELVRINR